MSRALTLAFALGILLSAGLLFTVEPMVSKLVLPVLGGSPGVWNTCLCFFQAMLLAGYLYAHLLTRRLALPAQLAVHAAVFLLAFTSLPPALPASLATPPAGTPVFWLLGLLATTIGLPFFVLSATAPLLQHWYSRTTHADARDPYFLYAASNAGSLVALFAYPLLIEPRLALAAQGRGWTIGYATLLALLLLGYALAARMRVPAASAVDAAGAARLSTRQRLRWLALALLPSSLLLGVTTHITTDLASAPLFWVIPLGLYLLSFVISFSHRPLLRHAWMLRALPLLLILAVLMPMIVPGSLWPILPGLLAFFVIAMVCHGELARQRPAARQLTEFYLLLSLGGVAGGIVNAILAPLLFDGVYEYPLALAAACLLLPREGADSRRARWCDALLPLALLALLLATRLLREPQELGALRLLTALRYLPAAVLLLAFSARPLRFALAVAACFVFAQLQAGDHELLQARSFFGVYRAQLADAGRVTVLMHGTTVHGAESSEPPLARTPLGYYSPAGPFGQLFAAAAPLDWRRIGIAGLGSGALACYATPGQRWTFHEIDPLVERLARDPRLFHFLERCGQGAQVVIGDARLTLREVPDGGYDLLVIDAFSSDSIPMHLMTREALALYVRKLAPHGLLAFHISNRYLQLAPIVQALAEDAHAAFRLQAFQPASEAPVLRFHEFPATLALIARGDEDFAFLDGDARWQRPAQAAGESPWRDDYSDILRAIRWR